MQIRIPSIKGAPRAKTTPVVDLSDPRPLLFLDVDGGLSPYPPQKPPWIKIKGRSPEAWVHPLLPAWMKDLGEQFQCVWVSSWREDANRFLAPQIGCPAFPLLPGGDRMEQILLMANGHPFAWVDDRITGDDVKQLARLDFPATAIIPDREFAISQGDVDSLLGFAKRLKSEAAEKSLALRKRGISFAGRVERGSLEHQVEGSRLLVPAAEK